MTTRQSQVTFLAMALGFVLCAAVWPARAWSQDAAGHVQVDCEPGVKIFLDGEFKGTTNAADGGLILQDVSAGRHRIKSTKEGFAPQEEEITVESKKVLRYKVQAFRPPVKITEEGREEAAGLQRKTGTLIINSLPIECDIDAPTLGVSGFHKTKDTVKLDEVPEGSHNMAFRSQGKMLNHKTIVDAGKITKVFVNFVEGKVEEENEAVRIEKQRKVEEENEAVRIAKKRKEEEEAERKADEFKKGGGVIVWLDAAKTIEMKLVRIKAGRFMMGTNRYNENASPAHEVILTKDYWMQTTEVTQRQWKTVMGENPSNSKGDDCPVEEVSWHDCKTFLGKLNEKVKDQIGGRVFGLPTEAEWEYACRAGSTGKWSFEDDDGKWGARSDDEKLTDYAWYYKNSSGGGAHPVGQKKPNGWGLYDMHGNVGEWCEDWYVLYAGSSIKYEKGRFENERAVRGGDFSTYADTGSSGRSSADPSTREYYIGFRAVLR